MPRPSPARRALTWWFAAPYNPWVAASFAVDVTGARAFLGALPMKISLNTLVAASIARALRRHPRANGRVVGRRIVLQERVGMAMPVNLADTAESSEVTMVVVEEVDTMTLAELAERTRARVKDERAGKRSHPLVDAMFKIAEVAPDRVFNGSLDLVSWAASHHILGPRIYDRLGVTTGLTNVGATMSQQGGMLFRAVSIAPPQRLFQVGTFFGASVVQDEVIAVDGRPEVRPMLPMMMLFDHRLIDGVAASRLGLTLGEILRDPGSEFGRDGSG